MTKTKRLSLKLAIVAALFLGSYFIFASFLGGGILNGSGVTFVQ